MFNDQFRGLQWSCHAPAFLKCLVVLDDAFLGELINFWVMLSKNLEPSGAPVWLLQMQMGKTITKSNGRLILQIYFLDILKPKL